METATLANGNTTILDRHTVAWHKPDGTFIARKVYVTTQEARKAFARLVAAFGA